MKIKVGKEIEAYCTKCRLMLDHVVVAMTGEKPKKVECLTCHGQHVYKSSEPKSRKKADTKKATSKKSSEPQSSKKADTQKASSKTKVEKPKVKKKTKAELAQEKERKLWEETLANKDLTLAKPYSMADSYESDDVIDHSKFGKGIVTNVINSQKMEVLFEDGYKSMVYNFSK